LWPIASPRRPAECGLSGGLSLIRLIDFARSFTGLIDPEEAHRLAINALKLFPSFAAGRDDPRLGQTVFGLDFPNPIGLAAGFDKNGEVPDAALRLGFGFAEVGTITPLPQPGNPRPRLFRLPQAEGVINRLGFNNEGFEGARPRLEARVDRNGIVGVNVGANKDSADRVADYVEGIKTFTPVANYLVVNISSPNTPGLRELQAPSALDDLLARVLEARDSAVHEAGRKPVLLKISPDLSLPELDELVSIAQKRTIDGMIVSNTTVSRPALLRDLNARETGGLSGKPLFSLSTWMLTQTYQRVGKSIPLVGVGGVDSADTAWAKIAAGATLVQLYSGLVYKGFGLVAKIKDGLNARIKRLGYNSIAEAIGSDAR
jgi:dihydroorotate dehydrogenase